MGRPLAIQPCSKSNVSCLKKKEILVGHIRLFLLFKDKQYFKKAFHLKKIKITWESRRFSAHQEAMQPRSKELYTLKQSTEGHNVWFYRLYKKSRLNVSQAFCDSCRTKVDKFSLRISHEKHSIAVVIGTDWMLQRQEVLSKRKQSVRGQLQSIQWTFLCTNW